MADNWRAPDPGQQSTPGVQPGFQLQMQYPAIQHQPPAPFHVPCPPPPSYRPGPALLRPPAGEPPEYQFQMMVPGLPQPAPPFAQPPWPEQAPNQPMPPQDPPQAPAPLAGRLPLRDMSPTSRVRWMAEHPAEEVARTIFQEIMNAPAPSNATAGPLAAPAFSAPPGNFAQPGHSGWGYSSGRAGTALAASQQEEPSSTQGMQPWRQYQESEVNARGAGLPPASSPEGSTSSGGTNDHLINHPYSPTTPPEPCPINPSDSPSPPPVPDPANPPDPPATPPEWYEPTPQRTRPVSPGTLGTLHYGYGVQMWEVDRLLSILPPDGDPITVLQLEAAARLRDLLHVVPQGLFRCIVNHLPPEQRRKLRKVRQKTYQIRKGENKMLTRDHRLRMEREMCHLRRQAVEASLREDGLRREITALQLQLTMCSSQLQDAQNQIVTLHQEKESQDRQVASYRRLRGIGIAADVAARGYFQDNDSD